MALLTFTSAPSTAIHRRTCHRASQLARVAFGARCAVARPVWPSVVPVARVVCAAGRKTLVHHAPLLSMPITTTFHPSLWHDRLSRSPPPVVTTWVTLVKLRLFAEPSLSSTLLGNLPPGDLCVILERTTLKDGTKRAKVLCEPRGLSPGWVNLKTNDGQDSLGYFCEQGNGLLLSGAYGSVFGLDLTPPAPPPAALLPPTEADVVGSTEELFWGPTSSSAALAPAPATSFARRGRAMKLGKFRAAAVTVGTQQVQRNLLADRMKMLSSAELRDLAQRHRRMANEDMQVLRDVSTSLEVRLGTALANKKLRVKDLVVSWCKRPSLIGGGGEINKMEFRKNVRSLLEEPDVATIDDLFASLDTDGGGSLDLDELTAAMKLLQETAIIDERRKEKARERLRLNEEREKQAEAVALETAEAEAADQRLHYLESQEHSIAARVGALLFRKHLRVNEIVDRWENTSGEVNREQFRSNLRTLDHEATLSKEEGDDDSPDEGLMADDAEIDQLFDQFDLDMGGTLDVRELKAALNLLKGNARESGDEISKLNKECTKAWSKARDAQFEFRALREADDKAAKEKEAAAKVEGERQSEKERNKAMKEEAKAKAHKSRTAVKDYRGY